MRIRLYLDEDAMDSDLVRALRLRGVDVMTALDAGLTLFHDEQPTARSPVGENSSLLLSINFLRKYFWSGLILLSPLGGED
ncbi:MAG TPA: hypothetical protein VGN86_09955 [Pyrinomonadaceae bacterium]|jgi:hypothetical protein|nr:hypothetical protein [Pyrinomonadaceae bacterium]